jgi:EmrB/QacA subfamily drug resistance transporter
MAQEGGSRRWWILAAMTGTLSMMMLDSTVVSVALPSIQADLDLTQTELQWVVNAYLLALAAFVAVAGRISDMFNRVQVMIAGIAIFVFFSAMCGLAQSETWLIGSRALQGIGAALMIPPTATIVVNTFGVDERGKAMGIYAGISMIFLSLGPLIGGVLTESLDWRWVFWVNLPVGLITIAMVLWTRPEGRVEGGQTLDKLGLVTLVPGLTLLVLGFMEASNWGWGSAKTIGAIAVGALLLVVFAFIERREASPLVELRLFGVRNFRGDTTVLFFAQFALMGLTIFGAIFTQDILGFTPIEAGLGLLPVTLPLLVAAPLAGRIYDRTGPRALATAGTLAAAIGFAITAAVLSEQEYWRHPSCAVRPPGRSRPSARWAARWGSRCWARSSPTSRTTSSAICCSAWARRRRRLTTPSASSRRTRPARRRSRRGSRRRRHSRWRAARRTPSSTASPPPTGPPGV